MWTKYYKICKSCNRILSECKPCFSCSVSSCFPKYSFNIAMHLCAEIIECITITHLIFTHMKYLLTLLLTVCLFLCSSAQAKIKKEFDKSSIHTTIETQHQEKNTLSAEVEESPSTQNSSDSNANPLSTTNFLTIVLGFEIIISCILCIAFVSYYFRSRTKQEISSCTSR